MKNPSRLADLSLAGSLALILLSPLTGRAQYHYFNVSNNSDCIMQDYRSVNVPGGIYDAIHEEYHTSSDGGTGYFYGGFTHQNNVNGNPSTLVQYVCWPAGGSFPVSYAQQIPFYAGTNMAPNIQIGEGSSCSIKGYWPQFTTNLWTREVVRYWLPADGTPHQGYQGMWIKEPVSGNWYHVATFLYPFAVTGVNGMSGWQENFTGYTGDYKVNHANGYYHKTGAWQMANQLSCTSNGHTYLINTNTAVQSDVGPDYTSLYNNPNTLTMTGQPALPTFDPILVSNYTASVLSTQLLVQWQMPQSSSPQLGYRVDVFNNSSYTGAVSVTYYDNDPEARQKLLNLSGIATPYVRLTISDIFFNTNAAILITPATVTPSAATNAIGSGGGLTFQYYESSSGNWGSLPNFSALTPVYQGAVATTDVTPRRQRINYGFNYTGFITAPTTGFYAFTLHSGDGSVLTIDTNTVISFDGLHDSSQFMSGGIALAAGQHTFNVKFFKGAANPVNTTAYTDGIGLAWEGPGITKTDVPASAYSRMPGVSEPAITLASPTNNASLPNSNIGVSATVTTNGNTINSVRFYLTDYYSYYFRPSSGVDYYMGQDTSAPYVFNSMVWTAPTNLVRARLVYNTTNMIDSAPVSIVTTNSSLGAWYWNPLEMHNYPSGVSVQGNTTTLLGDGMNFLSRKVTGDCTLVGRLASITPNTAGLDGVSPDSSWRAGIIFRGTTNTVVGQPLGDGSATRFTALFSSVGGGTYYENDYMRNGNGDANAWSGNLGGGNNWYKIQRVGDWFTNSVSMDGVNWTVVNYTNLTSIGSTIYAGVFIHALQSFNPNIHMASLDSYSLTGTNVFGPASVAISPLTNAVVGGLPATFAASVVGQVPAGYQWQLNGTNIANATNFNYSITSAAITDVGTYTVVANSVTSAPAFLLITAPAGSGVWTNLSGGSWIVSNNWSGGLISSGIDAAADFSTLSLSASPTVSLNGARTNGTLVFDDLNPTNKHSWTLATGSSGPLTLATSSGTPNIAVKSATNIISAVVAGTQGFTKTGAGYLTLSAASTFTGTATVSAGTLEMQNKSGDIPYTVAQGATLKIGYSTGGGYASTSLSVNGNGVSDTNGFYLKGGKTYNSAGTITLLGAPTTIRQYGSGLASIGTFDINSGQGIYCTANASGSVVDSNVQMISDGYGMIGYTDPGANTAAGDLTINGPLNVTSLGFYKRGTGSLVLNGTATSANLALNLQAGTVICGVTNCIGANATVPISSGATLVLSGFNQTIANLNTAAGSSLTFGGTNILTVTTNATLAGTMQMVVNKNASATASKLVVTIGALTNGGTLTIVNQSTGTLAAGDTFTLFSAPSFAGNFTTLNLPMLPVGLIWDSTSLATAGTLAITTVGSNVWNGAGTDNNWSTAANWNGTAPANWNLLVFQGATRTLNTNNLLTAAGQIVLSNGGFTLRGNPLAIEWGLLNLAGNNTNAINLTLAAPQSFVSSNGLLAVTAAVTNGGYNLTVDGAGSNLISGVVSGAGGLVKNGGGPLTLFGANSYSGATTVNAGKVSLGNSSALGTSAVTVGAGGALDVNSFSPANTLTIAGTGASGVSALFSSSATNQPAVGQVTLAADATLGAAADVKTNGISTAGINLAGNTLTLTSGRLVVNGSDTITSGNMILNSGTVLYFSGYSGANAGGAGTLTINSGAVMDVRDFNNSAFGNVPGISLNGGQITCGGSTAPSPGNGGGTVLQIISNPLTIGAAGGTLSGNDGAFGGTSNQYYLTFSGALAGTGPLTNNSTKGIELQGDTSGYTGVMTNSGPISFNGNADQVFNGTLTGTAALQKNGANNLTLSGTNTYTGGTTFNSGVVQVNSPETAGVSGPLGKSTAVNKGNISFAGGTLKFGPANAYDYSGRFSTAAGQPVSVDVNGQNVTFATALTNSAETLTLTSSTGSGWLALAATNTYTGATTVSGGTLLVNGFLAAGSTVTVAAGGTLGGTGFVKGPATVQAGGALAPGNNGIGTLTISNTLSLSGNTLMEVSRNGGVPTNDVAFITSTFTQGGTLTVTNIGTNALAAGDSFKLFNATTYVSAFTNLALPSLTNGLSWKTNTLATNGTLAVVLNIYTLAYTAGANGTISGTSTQTVNYGASGSAVTAVPNTGYHFVNWSDASTSNPRTDTNVTNNLAVTANFAINTYTLIYLGGTNGTLTGTATQTVNYAASGTAVTPVPNTGYHFVNWSDSSTANPRTDTNVTNNITVTANFAINTYTLTYNAGANGTNSGISPQTVNYGASGSAVTAVPTNGYHFVNWSDSSTANPRTDANVTNNISVTANFAINTYTLTYNAAANGTNSGISPQTVSYGASGSAVTAVPTNGYHFVNWSDSSSANPRTDANVTNNITVTANFAINTYTLIYLVGTNGTLTGTTTQTVNYAASGSAMSAVPNTGYTFTNWSDGSLANPRTDANVTNNVTVTANFTANPASVVALTWPANGSGYPAPASISLTASVTTNGNVINAVQFISNTTNLLAQVTNAPYTYAWTNVAAGSYTLVARVLFNGSLSNASSAAVITVSNAVAVVPVIAAGTVTLTGGGFTLSGTGGAGQTYILLGAVNLVAPVWTPIATNVAGTNGVFNFTDPDATNNSQRFYRITTP